VRIVPDVLYFSRRQSAESSAGTALLESGGQAPRWPLQESMQHFIGVVRADLIEITGHNTLAERLRSR